MFECLPDSIVREILLSLPLKSIGKCMSVCKLWNTMIKSPTFISSHLKYSLFKPSPPLFLLREFYPSFKHNYSLWSSFPKIPNVECSFWIPDGKSFGFVAALNGIVCLYDYRTFDIFLLNPSIRRHLQLPKSIDPESFHWRRDLLGFGFDSKKNDFKVVQICHPTSSFITPPKVVLYSLNEGHPWRVIDASYIDLTIDFCSQQFFSHENVYWFAYKGASLHSNYILMFNMVEEKFNRMELPKELVTVSLHNLVVTIIEGCLSLIDNPRGIEKTDCSIWMRKEESWTKMYNIYLAEGIEKLFGPSQTSEVFALSYPHGPHGEIGMSLHSFDLKSKEMRDLGINRPKRSLYACYFRESLVLLDQESNIATSFWSQDDMKMEQGTHVGTSKEAHEDSIAVGKGKRVKKLPLRYRSDVDA